MSGPERTVGAQGLVFNEPLIFEQGSPGRVGYSLPPCDVPEKPAETLIPPHLLRGPIPGLPEVSEVDVVRHYTRISQWNFGIDLGFYPLGSCTMKYNPRVNEDMVRLPGFAKAHPYLPDALAQGALELLWELERYLAEISGLDRVSLHPSAGRARRADRRHDDPRLPSVQRQPAAQDHHPRVGSRNQPGQLGALRLSGGAGEIGAARRGGARGSGRGDG